MSQLVPGKPIKTSWGDQMNVIWEYSSVAIREDKLLVHNGIKAHESNYLKVGTVILNQETSGKSEKSSIMTAAWEVREPRGKIEI